MSNVKGYMVFLLSLLVAVIILRFILKKSQGLPLIGSVAKKADDLAFE